MHLQNKSCQHLRCSNKNTLVFVNTVMLSNVLRFVRTDIMFLIRKLLEYFIKFCHCYKLYTYTYIWCVSEGHVHFFISRCYASFTNISTKAKFVFDFGKRLALGCTCFRHSDYGPIQWYHMIFFTRVFLRKGVKFSLKYKRCVFIKQYLQTVPYFTM